MLLLELDFENPPVAFAASTPKQIGTFRDGRGTLWRTSIKAFSPEIGCRLFEPVLFWDCEGVVSLIGMETPDGTTEVVGEPHSTLQYQFMFFLKERTHLFLKRLAPRDRANAGLELSCEARATAAVIHALDKPYWMRLGVLKDSGEYTQVTMDSKKLGLLAIAEMTPAFDDIEVTESGD